MLPVDDLLTYLQYITKQSKSFWV